MKIDHIGIAVKSMKESGKLYEDLGVEMEHTEVLDGMKIGFYPFGESTIELLEPVDTSSAIGKFIEKKGEGIHHIAINVPDVAKKLKELEEKGYVLIDKVPRMGAHGKKIAFIHPKSTNGVLLEICEG
ncbi:MAG: methylmalonyl-CoA epimerase [Candidatus Muirbacterium halophilum]|nr:methylmalonyl-CoA epimerase [Candidatus Muirbacterium halophilum]MCK9474549.1 methylmalonyl-CoA epimerase [Candidatus Muirbacterium halophilum]